MSRVPAAALFLVALVLLPAAGAAGQAAQAPQTRPVVVFETQRGTFEIQFYADEAPRSVEHLLALVRRNFYNQQRVHRVAPGFVVQFGDPNTRDMTKRNIWGQEGSGRPIGVAEINPRRTHRLGAVALAHAGDPARADSQIYIALAPTARYEHLEGSYAVIGQVVSGMEVVQALRETDIIRRATIKN